MLTDLLLLLIWIVATSIITWLLIYLVDMLPVEGRFKSIIRILIIVIAVVSIIRHIIDVFSLPPG
jgi:hypothetical protein